MPSYPGEGNRRERERAGERERKRLEKRWKKAGKLSKSGSKRPL
jgi:hypothetical protein